MKQTNELIGKKSFSATHAELRTSIESHPLKILMLEDNLNDAELIERNLKSSKLHFQTVLVSAKSDYIKMLENEPFDVILSDHNLPQFSSLEALRIRNKLKFHIPFILVSGAVPEEYAVTILQEGANDYVLKDRPQRLSIAITEAIKKQKAITAKLIADEELLKVNERLRLVGQATADAIWDYDIKNDSITRGEGYEILFGYNLQTVSKNASEWTERVHPDDVIRVSSEISSLLVGKVQNHWEIEYRYKKADGSYTAVRDKGIVLRDEDGLAFRIVGAMQDISHVRKLEMEILEKDLYNQKKNTEIIIQAQEQERNTIGKELHDNINQLMASAKMMIDTSRSSPNIREICIDKGYETISLAIEEIRKLSHALVPPSFNDYGTFVCAVNDLAENINSFLSTGQLSIKVNLSSDKEYRISDEKVKLTFYRIIQEQITNIIKHSKASLASISLEVLKNTYLLKISDNGIGFDPARTLNGIGLQNINSRVALLGGKMEVIASAGKGCTLLIEVPFVSLVQ